MIRTDLEPLVLDELLQTVSQKDVAVIAQIPDIAGAQPTLAVEAALGRLLVIQVTKHNIWSAAEDLALLTLVQGRTTLGVGDLSRRVGGRGACQLWMMVRGRGDNERPY